MNITDVRVTIINKENSKLKAVVSITIDNALAVHDIKIIEGSESVFISMPSKKVNENEYKNVVHPINAEVREELTNVILKAYQAELEKVENA